MTPETGAPEKSVVPVWDNLSLHGLVNSRVTLGGRVRNEGGRVSLEWHRKLPVVDLITTFQLGTSDTWFLVSGVLEDRDGVLTIRISDAADVRQTTYADITQRWRRARSEAEVLEPTPLVLPSFWFLTVAAQRHRLQKKRWTTGRVVTQLTGILRGERQPIDGWSDYRPASKELVIWTVVGLLAVGAVWVLIS